MTDLRQDTETMRFLLSTFLSFVIFLPGSLLAASARPDVQQVDVQVAKEAGWARDAARCPAALLPKHVLTDYMMGDSCDINPGLCLLKCEA
jgi:hypothetical protein